MAICLLFVYPSTNVDDKTELRTFKKTFIFQVFVNELFICIVQLNGHDVIIKQLSMFFHLILLM